MSNQESNQCLTCAANFYCPEHNPSVFGYVQLQQFEPCGDNERLLSGSQDLHEHANVLPELGVGEVGVGNTSDGVQHGKAELDIHAGHGTPNGVMVDAVPLPSQAALDSPSFTFPPGVVTSGERRAFIMGVAAGVPGPDGSKR